MYIIDYNQSDRGAQDDSAMHEMEAVANPHILHPAEPMKAYPPSDVDTSDSAEAPALKKLSQASSIIGAAAVVVSMTQNKTKKRLALDGPVDSQEPPVSFLKNARRKRRCTAISS